MDKESSPSNGKEELTKPKDKSEEKAKQVIKLLSKKHQVTMQLLLYPIPDKVAIKMIHLLVRMDLLPLMKKKLQATTAQRKP